MWLYVRFGFLSFLTYSDKRDLSINYNHFYFMQSYTELKGKVNYGKLDLSSFLVSSLVQGLGVKNMPVNYKAAAAPKTEVMNVELTISGKDIEPSSVYGEVVICDFIAGLKNTQAKSHDCLRLGQNLNHDNFMHKLNSGLRVSATEFVLGGNQEMKDKIKAQVKDLEESGFIADLTENSTYGTFGILHAMFYCFVEPVSKLTNKKVQTALKKIADAAGLQSFASFVKNEGKQGEKKASKDV